MQDDCVWNELINLDYLYTVKPVCNDHLYNKIYLLPMICSVMCLNQDWRYQFTLVNNICLLELI